MTAIHAATDRSSVTNPSKITRVDHVAPNAAGPHDDRPLAPAVPAFSLFLTRRSCSVSPEAASASTWFLVVGQAPAARSGDGHLEDRSAVRPSALRWPARRHHFHGARQRAQTTPPVDSYTTESRSSASATVCAVSRT